MKSIAFFNNFNGMGKSWLIYHLAVMYTELCERVLLADFHPDAKLTSCFLDEDCLEQLWPDGEDHPDTVLGGLAPVIKGTGDIEPAPLQPVTEQINLIPGDIALPMFEDRL